ncbi:MAG: hypothetical protein ACK5LP_04955 [Campylobacteraceae bacterium]
MKRNKDEAYLLGQIINEDSKTKVEYQALRIALFSHIKLYEKAKLLVEKFSSIPPFVDVLKCEEEAIGALVVLFEKYEVELVKNTTTSYIKLSNSFLEACEIGVADELSMILMYNKFIPLVKEEDIKDLFYKLQALSYNELLPQYRNFLHVNTKQSSELSSFSQEKIIEKVGEFSNLANDLASGNIKPEQVNKMLGSLNLPLISGVLLGGLGAMVAKEIKDDKENDGGEK